MNKSRRGIIKLLMFSTFFLSYFNKSSAKKNIKINQRFKKKKYKKFYWYLNEND